MFCYLKEKFEIKNIIDKTKKCLSIKKLFFVDNNEFGASLFHSVL